MAAQALVRSLSQGGGRRGHRRRHRVLRRRSRAWRQGFKERADHGRRSCCGDASTAFVLVASPKADTVAEAGYFAGRAARARHRRAGPDRQPHAAVLRRCGRRRARAGPPGAEAVRARAGSLAGTDAGRPLHLPGRRPRSWPGTRRSTCRASPTGSAPPRWSGSRCSPSRSRDLRVAGRARRLLRSAVATPERPRHRDAAGRGRAGSAVSSRRGRTTRTILIATDADEVLRRGRRRAGRRTTTVVRVHAGRDVLAAVAGARARPGRARPADRQHGRRGRPALDLRLEESAGRIAPQTHPDAARPHRRRVPGPARRGRRLAGQAARRASRAAAGASRAGLLDGGTYTEGLAS